MAIIKKTKRKPWEPERDKVWGKHQAFYNSPAWRNLARAKRMATPWCEECYRAGRVQAGALVDHIQPITQGGDPISWDNLQTLCTSCHNAKSARERNREK